NPASVSRAFTPPAPSVARVGSGRMSGRSRVLLSFLCVLACAVSGAAFARPGAHVGLTPFRSEKEMLEYFKKIKAASPQRWNTPLGDDLNAVTVTGTKVQA